MTSLVTVPKYTLDYKESVWDTVSRISPRVNAVCRKGRKTPSKCALFMPGMGFHCIDAALNSGLINRDTALVLVERDREKVKWFDRLCNVRGFSKWGILNSRVEEADFQGTRFDYIYLDTDSSVGEDYCKLLLRLDEHVYPKSDVVVSCVLDKPLKFQEHAYEILTKEYKGRKSPYLTFYQELMSNMTNCGAKRLIRKKAKFPMWETSNLLIWSSLSASMRIKLLSSEEFRDGKNYLTNRYRIKSIGRLKSDNSYLVKAILYDIEKERRQAKRRRDKARESVRSK